MGIFCFAVILDSKSQKPELEDQLEKFLIDRKRNAFEEQLKNIFVVSPIFYQSAFAGKPNAPTRPHIPPRNTTNSRPHRCSFVFNLSQALEIYIYIYDATVILCFLLVICVGLPMSYL
jgi:hypothetical protein